MRRESSLELFTAGYRLRPSENSYSHWSSWARISSCCTSMVCCHKTFQHGGVYGLAGSLSAALASPGALWLLLSKDMTPKYTWQTQGLSDGCPTLSVDCSQLKEREWSVNITQLLINLSLMCGGHITGIDIWIVREWICAVCVCVFGKFMVWLYVFITESHFICANLRKISN